MISPVATASDCERSRLSYQVVGDLLVVALVDVGRRHPHDLGSNGGVLEKKILQ